MSFTERNLTSLFHKYIRTKQPSFLKHSFLIEFKCKHNKEKLHLYSDFQDHQIPTLLQATKDCLYYKISDLSIGKKPCDSFQSCYVQAYIGVCWYKLRQPKIIYLIPVQEIEKKMKQKEKTISEKDAEQIANYILTL